MPTHPCEEDGKPGWRWGDSGKCYTYTRGDEEGSKRAHAKADAQGAAVHSTGWHEKGNIDDWTLEELEVELAKLKKDLEELKKCQ